MKDDQLLRLPTGGYILTGFVDYVVGGNTADIYLIKTDSQGNIAWAKNIGGNDNDFGYSLDLTSDGGYIITGETRSYGAGGYDLFLMRTDSLGDTLWTKTYGGISNDCGNSVKQVTGGGYVVVGNTRSFGAGNNDIWLLKTDSLGDTLWERTYGSVFQNYGNSVIENSDRNYVISGGDWDANYNISGRIIDTLGDSLRGWYYGGYEDDIGYSIIQSINKNYITLGYTKSFGAGNEDVYVFKSDPIGQFVIWSRVFGGINTDWGYCVANTSDSGFIICGYTESFGSGGADVYLIKTDSLGNVAEVKEQPDHRTSPKSIKFNCFPNPFTTVTSIQLHGTDLNQESYLYVYNQTGRFVKSVKMITKSYQFSSDLPPGVYFLKINVGEYIETKKLIKIK
jgi:hypothetical protein